MHKRSDSFFSKILEKPSIVQKKMIPHINRLLFTEMKQKNLENGRLKKKTHFPAPPILNIFHGLVLGLVELIDGKGIGVTQLIWS